MLRKLIFSIFLLTVGGPAIGSDAAAGKSLSARCIACHGQAGISANPEWPNLAGQKGKYLASQIRAFRDGNRESALMAPMVKGLSDAEIEDLAAYYSSL